MKKNIIPAHKGNIITGENLYKTPCIKPIYKYKRICASAEPAQWQTFTVDTCWAKKKKKKTFNKFFFLLQKWHDILFHTLSASKMSSTRNYNTKKKNHSSTKNCFLYSSCTFADYLHIVVEHSSTAVYIITLNRSDGDH